MRPSLGSVSSKGCFRISRSYDGIGAMAKCPEDLRMVVEAILTPEAKSGIPEGGFKSALMGKKGLEGMRIGFVESTWGTGEGKWGSDPVVSLQLSWELSSRRKH
jgi:amidase